MSVKNNSLFHGYITIGQTAPRSWEEFLGTEKSITEKFIDSGNIYTPGKKMIVAQIYPFENYFMRLSESQTSRLI